MAKQSYSGRSIASQLLEGTKLGKLLYGEPETYTDGYGKTRSHASLEESANGQQLKRMKDTAVGAGKVVAENVADTAMDVGHAAISASKGDWKDAAMYASFIALPQIAEAGVKSAAKYLRRTDLDFDTIYELKQSGLTDIDIDRLLQRGWSPRQIFEAHGRHGLDFAGRGKSGSNVKAKLLDSDMKWYGMKPELISRADDLIDQSKSGVKIVKDKFGNPHTLDEWNKLPLWQRGSKEPQFVDKEYILKHFNDLL